jgi:hypothetical protein
MTDQENSKKPDTTTDSRKSGQSNLNLMAVLGAIIGFLAGLFAQLFGRKKK